MFVWEQLLSQLPRLVQCPGFSRAVVALVTWECLKPWLLWSICWHVWECFLALLPRSICPGHLLGTVMSWLLQVCLSWLLWIFFAVLVTEEHLQSRLLGNVCCPGLIKHSCCFPRLVLASSLILWSTPDPPGELAIVFVV